MSLTLWVTVDIKDEGQFFQFFQINTYTALIFTHVTSAASPFCAQRGLSKTVAQVKDSMSSFWPVHSVDWVRLLHKLKIPCPHFDKRRPNSLWHKDTEL